MTFNLWYQLLWHTVILLWFPKKAPQQKNNLARLIVYFCSIAFHKNHESIWPIKYEHTPTWNLRPFHGIVTPVTNSHHSKRRKVQSWSSFSIVFPMRSHSVPFITPPFLLAKYPWNHHFGDRWFDWFKPVFAIHHVLLLASVFPLNPPKKYHHWLLLKFPKTSKTVLKCVFFFRLRYPKFHSHFHQNPLPKRISP